MRPPLLTLPADELHLWHAPVAMLDDESVRAACQSLLTSEEKQRQERYYFQRNRDEFLVTRALVRTTLSRYSSIEPRAWRFAQGAHGKPFIATEHETDGLCFNLSNTHGHVVCAVARKRELGVDLEDPSRSGDTVEIADRFFSPREVADLHALPAELQRERFFAIWTLKEAYIKARGTGLSLGLDGFSFIFETGDAVRIEIDPALNDDPARWQFTRFAMNDRVGAVCVARAANESVNVVFQTRSAGHWQV